MKLTLSMLTILLFAFVAYGQDEPDKGIELYLLGDYNSAITVLQNVVQTDKNNRDAWFYLGMSLARVKKNKEALKALRKGDSISSRDSSNYDKELKIISKPRCRYTDLARENLITGTVRLAVEFGADATIKSIVAVQSLPFGLTEDCIAAAKNIKFEPATKNGKPVTNIKVISYSFDIR
jgi:tetratricopeptide (TPR) repeat protein